MSVRGVAERLPQRRRAIGALGLALLWLAALPAAAQQGFEIRKVEKLHLDDIVTGREGERQVELYLRALTRYSDPVEELRAVDLAIRDVDEAIDPEEVTLQLLSDTGRGMTCVLAIDTSRTMKGEPFNRAKAAALQLMDLIESRDRVAIVAFSDEPRVVAGFDASRAEARVELESLEVDADSLSTALYDGVHAGIELIRTGASLPRRAFLIVFSDGKDGASQRSLEQVIEFAQGDEIRPPALVFTIGYARFGGEGLAALSALAEETDADFLQATSTIHLPSFFADIWKQMKRSYVVTYPGEMDGEVHTVEVSVDGQTARRTVRYADIPAPWWPYVAVIAAVLAIGAIVWLVVNGRPAGRLVFQSGPLAGQTVRLNRSRLRIGAVAENNDLVIESTAISRCHAVIYRRGRSVEIEDLNSTNGTFVNGMPVRTAPLEPKDKVRLADVEMVYER